MVKKRVPCGDCFRWAVQKAGELELQGPTRVVHALISPRHYDVPKIPHAYVEFGGPQGVVYDWQREVMGLEPISIDLYEAQMHPIQPRRYKHLEALRLSVEHGHWGPWAPWRNVKLK